MPALRGGGVMKCPICHDDEGCRMFIEWYKEIVPFVASWRDENKGMGGVGDTVTWNDVFEVKKELGNEIIFMCWGCGGLFS
jgi:hypothetical protein